MKKRNLSKKIFPLAVGFCVLASPFNCSIAQDSNSNLANLNTKSNDNIQKIIDEVNNASDSQKVDIPDPNLKQGLYSALNKDITTPITVGELKKITELSPEQCAPHNSCESTLKVKNLEGIQYCINIEKLSLAYQRCTDITPLATLKKLKHLDIRGLSDDSGKRLTDISPLKELVNLEFLNIRQARAENLNDLKNLTKLKELDVNANYIENIDFLKDMTKLEKLDLGYNKLTDISALKNMKNLTYLNLGGFPRNPINSNYPRIKDISILANLTNIKELDLASQDIVDISALKNLKKLENLAIQSNKIENFEPILELEYLKELWPQENPKDLNNKIENFYKAKNYYDKLNTSELDNKNLSTIKELLAENDLVKNYFKNSTIQKINTYKTKLENNEKVKNDLFGNAEDTQNSEIISIENPKDLTITTLDNIDTLLPKTVKVKVRKVHKKDVANHVGLLTKNPDNGYSHMKIAIIDENGNLIKENINFNNGISNIKTKNGYLEFDATGIPYNKYNITLADNKYEMETPFTFQKTTMFSVTEICDKNIQNMTNEDINKLLVIKLKTKNTNPAPTPPAPTPHENPEGGTSTHEKVGIQGDKAYLNIVDENGNKVNGLNLNFIDSDSFGSTLKVEKDDEGYYVKTNGEEYTYNLQLTSNDYSLRGTFSLRTKYNAKTFKGEFASVIKDGKISNITETNKNSKDLFTIVVKNLKTTKKKLTGEEVIEAKKAGATIIDVRVKEQFNAGHIEGAINLPLASIREEISKYATKDKKIVLYCNSGNQSSKALDILNNLGYTNAYDGAGVREYGYDLVKTTTPQTPTPHQNHKIGIYENKVYLNVIDEKGDKVKDLQMQFFDNDSYGSTLKVEKDENGYFVKNNGEEYTYNLQLISDKYALKNNYSLKTKYNTKTFKGEFASVIKDGKETNINETNKNSEDLFTIIVKNKQQKSNIMSRSANIPAEENEEIEEIEMPVTWDKTKLKQEVGKYTLEGTLSLPKGIKNPNNLKPKINITINEAEAQECYFFIKDSHYKPVKENVNIVLTNEKGEKINTILKDGNLKTKLKAGKYNLKITSSDYETKETNFDVINDDGILTPMINGEIFNEILITKKSNTNELKSLKEKAIAELEKLDQLTKEEKDGFEEKINKAKEKAKVSETLEQAKAKNTANKELKEAKEKAIKEVTELKNLTEAEKTKAALEINKANTKEEVNTALDKAKELDKKHGAENPNVNPNPTPTPDVTPNPNPDVTPTPAPEVKVGWKNNEIGWWYQRANGTYPHSEWEIINGTWYHFNENGYMQTGWLNSGGSWYYLNDDGSMAKDTWIGTYYVDENGAWVIEGWQQNSYGWWYQRANGTYPVSEWEIINGTWYYFDANGYMLADTTTPDGYYVDINGAWVK